MDTTKPELTLVAEFTRLLAVQLTSSSVPKEPAGSPDVKVIPKMPESNVTLKEATETEPTILHDAVSDKDAAKTKPDTVMDLMGCPVYGVLNLKVKVTPV
jgi:hypothetical protein